eukprot:13226-Heterococcus_DN1.PRE.1
MAGMVSAPRSGQHGNRAAIRAHLQVQISDGHFDSVYRDNVAATHTSRPKYQQCLVLHSNAGSNSTTKYPRRTPQPPNAQWQYSPSNLDNSAIEHRFL